MKAVDGAIVVDKPSDWTSHDVVNRIRKIVGTKKVGHLGTLDPMATGVLPLVVNKATRLAQFFIKNEKIYEGVIRFGHSTRSYDREGEPTSQPSPVDLDLARLEILADRFRGTFAQTPPPVSAKKIGGRKAYDLTREDKPVILKPVDVTVFAFDLLGLDHQDLKFRVHCTGGTYVRSIAHELGQLVGCGAYLQDLRRTASGDFTIEQAHTLEELEQMKSEGHLEQSFVPSSQLLPEIPSEEVDAITVGKIRQGRDFQVSPFRVRGGKYVKAIADDGSLVAIGEARLPNLYHPVLVF